MGPVSPGTQVGNRTSGPSDQAPDCQGHKQAKLREKNPPPPFFLNGVIVSDTIKWLYSSLQTPRNSEEIESAERKETEVMIRLGPVLG